MLENLIPFGAFAMVSWVVYVIVVTGFQAWYQRRTQSQFQSKMLDKIGSVSELGAFLNTEAGNRFLQGLSAEVASPHLRILRAVQSGAVLSTLGIALYLYGWVTPALRGEVTNAINALATIFFGLGVGFLMSASLSYRLSKQMGLLSGDQQRSDASTTPAL
jgi:hypothetical protein